MMLAQRGVVADIVTLQNRGYLFDLKIDGVRCKAEVADGVARLTSRSNTSLTVQYPEIVEGLQSTYPTGRVVLDGEVAVVGSNGFPSWPETHKRNAQQSRFAGWARRLPARFYAFDLLQLDATDMRHWTYADRRRELESEVQTWPAVLQSTPVTPDGDALWKLVREHRLEGIVAKRPDSRYGSGRNGDWIKIKRTSTVSCLVGGYDPGDGSRAATFGCLHLYLLDGSTLVPVGKVGSGFTGKELHKVMQALRHPPLIVEVEYLDRSPDGQLRQPVFQRVRDDLDITGCTINQLT